jgi:hypothetical protein
MSELVFDVPGASAESFTLPLEVYAPPADTSHYVIFIASTSAVQEAEQKRKRLGERFRQALEPFDGVVGVEVEDIGETLYVTVTTAELDMQLDLDLQRTLVEAAANWPEIDWTLRTRTE